MPQPDQVSDINTKSLGYDIFYIQESTAQIIQGSPIPTFVINADHIITHWNKACENLTGISAGQVVGTHQQWRAFYTERRPVLVDLIVDGKNEHEIKRYYGNNFSKSFVQSGAYEVEGFFPTLGGKGKWLFFTAAPLVNDEGSIVGGIETLQDITDRKQAELNLKESEDLYRTLFESAQDTILLMKDEIVKDCNANSLLLLDCLRSDIIGQSIFNFFPKRQPDGKRSSDMVIDIISALSRRQSKRFEFVCCRLDGQIFDAEVSLTNIDIQGGRFHLAIVRDVTHRKRMETDLLNQKNELGEKSRHLEEANRALKTMLDHRDVEKKAIEENMLFNLKKFVFPYLNDLEGINLPQTAENYLSIVRSNLDSLVSPISGTLLSKYQDLTPKEIQIADMVRLGRSTKEIADILSISAGLVSFHRNNIRKKLGLNNKRTNLRSYLSSLS